MRPLLLPEIPRSLALVLGLQIVACVYDSLGVAASIKIRMINGEQNFLPLPELSFVLKHYGWLLFALPLAWYWFQVRRWALDGADGAFLRGVIVSGVVLIVFLASLGVLGSFGAIRSPLIQNVPKSSKDR